MKQCIYAMLLLGMSIFVGSCSQTKVEDYPTTIVGQWKTSKLIDEDGTTWTPTDLGSVIYFTFTDSGKVVMEEIEDDGYAYSSKGNYWINGTTLHITTDYFTQTSEIKKLSKDELVFFSKGGDFEWWYLKRIE